jgi:hypothetical protein
MAKPNRQEPATAKARPKRYRSVAEIKRDLFPNAAAEEHASDVRRRGHEDLMDDFFGPRHRSQA